VTCSVPPEIVQGVATGALPATLFDGEDVELAVTIKVANIEILGLNGC